MYHQIKSFIAENAKIFAVALVLGLIIPVAFSPSIFADEDEYNPYDDYSYEDAIVQYHLGANAIFNMYLDFLTDEDFVDVTAVTADEDCDGLNVSTYCLAVQLNENLRLLEKSLMKREEFDFTVEDTLSLEEAIETSASIKSTLDAEIEAARDTLDLTLAVYNQAQIVYPVHLELKNLIDNLEDYRDNLAAVRDIVELFPGKFNDATTDQCQ